MEDHKNDEAAVEAAVEATSAPAPSLAPDLSDTSKVPEALWTQINDARDKVLALAKGSPELATFPTWLMVTACMAAAIRIAARAGISLGVLKGMFLHFWETEKGRPGAKAPAAPKGWKKTTATNLAEVLGLKPTGDPQQP